MNLMYLPSTAKHKAKRVLKYFAVLIGAMIICGFLDAIVYHFFNDPWFDFKDDWKFLYGMMAYRLISTWGYK